MKTLDLWPFSRNLDMNDRSNGQFYSKWQIELYSGNDPKRLVKPKKALVKHSR